jgi:hypothetical protein
MQFQFLYMCSHFVDVITPWQVLVSEYHKRTYIFNATYGHIYQCARRPHSVLNLDSPDINNIALRAADCLTKFYCITTKMKLKILNI